MGVLCTQAASLEDSQGALDLLVRRGQVAMCCNGHGQVVECHSSFWVLWTVVAFLYPQHPFEVVARCGSIAKGPIGNCQIC
eukprot:2352189-Amphidinium_carterae.1